VSKVGGYHLITKLQQCTLTACC